MYVYYGFLSQDTAHGDQFYNYNFELTVLKKGLSYRRAQNPYVAGQIRMYIQGW